MAAFFFRLRQDARVRLLEKTNARYLKPQDIQEVVEVVALDVSFISATLVLPAVVAAAFAHTPVERRQLLVLVKPQFEVGREQVGKGGIVRDPEAQAAAVEKLRQCAAKLGFTRLEVTESPILGMEGNREFLLYARVDEDG